MRCNWSVQHLSRSPKFFLQVLKILITFFIENLNHQDQSMITSYGSEYKGPLYFDMSLISMWSLICCGANPPMDQPIPAWRPISQSVHKGEPSQCTSDQAFFFIQNLNWYSRRLVCWVFWKKNLFFNFLSWFLIQEGLEQGNESLH
jgi:hypothetical protein